MEKEEFLKLLPKLIREDDQVKGAILSALSGVVSTKDDIQRQIEHSDKQFKLIEEQISALNNNMSKIQEILISHSGTLRKLVEGTIDSDVKGKLIRLESSSATQYKTLEGKIEQLKRSLNSNIEKIEENMATKDDIQELKDILTNI